MNKNKLAGIIEKELEELILLTNEVVKSERKSSLLIAVALGKARLLCQEIELLQELIDQDEKLATDTQHTDNKELTKDIDFSAVGFSDDESETDEPETQTDDEQDETPCDNDEDFEIEVHRQDDDDDDDEDEEDEDEDDDDEEDDEDDDGGNQDDEDEDEEDEEDEEEEDEEDEDEDEDDEDELTKESTDNEEYNTHNVEIIGTLDEDEKDKEPVYKYNIGEDNEEDDAPRRTIEFDGIGYSEAIQPEPAQTELSYGIPEVRKIVIEDDDFEPIKTFQPITFSQRPPMREIPKPEEPALQKEEVPTTTKNPSLNDTIAENKAETPNPVLGKISSLSLTIGLNDRMLFIKEIFGNNSEKYNTIIDNLDKLETTQQAVDYLRANLTMQKNEASIKFVELLKRRFAK